MESKATAEHPIPERLMRVSVELFARNGYAQTSVQQIVDAAGVTKGALYHYFDSKDDLLFDIYDRCCRCRRRTSTRSSRGDSTPARPCGWSAKTSS